MIKDVAGWQAWEDEYIRGEPVEYRQNLRMFEAMVEHARKLGKFPPQDPLEGIEFKLRFVRDPHALR